MTLHISEAAPHQIEADAVVIGVTKESGGAVPVPGTKDVDEALGGSLAQTLATLGATGEAGEITKIPSAGRLTAPLFAPCSRRAVRAARRTCGSRSPCRPARTPRSAPWPWARCSAGTHSVVTA